MPITTAERISTGQQQRFTLAYSAKNRKITITPARRSPWVDIFEIMLQRVLIEDPLLNNMSIRVQVFADECEPKDRTTVYRDLKKTVGSLMPGERRLIAFARHQPKPKPGDDVRRYSFEIRTKPFARSATLEYADVLPSSDIDSVPRIEGSEHKASDTRLSSSAVEATIVAQANAFRDAFTKATAELATSFDEWLRSLEGISLPKARIKKELAAINDAANAGGRQLILDGQPVKLLGQCRAKYKAGIIRAVTAGRGPQQDVWNRTAFPPLRTRPLK